MAKARRPQVLEFIATSFPRLCIDADPKLGLRAPRLLTEPSKTLGLANLRVCSLVASEDFEDMDGAAEVLGRVASHCRDLRALRWVGSDMVESDAVVDALQRIVDECRELRILWAANCGFWPTMGVGRAYALTHLHLANLLYVSPSGNDVRRWINACPRLRHLGIKFSEGVEGIDYMEAAIDDGANHQLLTLDLEGSGAAGHWEDDPDFERRIEAFGQQCYQRPDFGHEPLRITAPGSEMGGYDAEEFVDEVLAERRHLPTPGLELCYKDQRFENTGHVADPDTKPMDPYFWFWGSVTREFVGTDGRLIGRRVEVHGLQKAAEYNGRLGRVAMHEGPRARVRLDGRPEKYLMVKPVNLRPL